ncbi:MAG: hypothetical protein Q7T05_01235, partial [Dehalococcoidia bacterium]|nr:hypothetical protein [Dehalococcoidia bacterium]
MTLRSKRFFILTAVLLIAAVFTAPAWGIGAASSADSTYRSSRYTGPSFYWYNNIMTSGDLVRYKLLDSTLTSDGAYISCLGGTGATEVWKVGEGGIETFKGGATIDNATSATVLNLTETTVRATGILDVTGNSTLASVDVGGGSGGSGATITAAGLATFDGVVAANNGITVDATAFTVSGTTGAVSSVITRSADAYAYGFDINPDEAFFTGGAATKSYLLSVRGDRPVASAATGDSNDALIKVSGSNYAANDTNFIFRGINQSITNRDGGTLGRLEGANISAQGKSGGTVNNILGQTITAENYGTVSDMFGGLDIVLKNEAAVATAEYGIRIRNENNSIAGTVDAAIAVTDTGANTGWDYIIDADGATAAVVADIR